MTLQEYHDELYGLYSTVLALSKALYHLDEEKSPASVGVTISFALMNVSKSMEALCVSMQETIDGLLLSAPDDMISIIQDIA